MTKQLLLLAASLGTGLIAGTFFAFSSFVMGALGKLPPATGIAAMQSINIVVINPLFMAVLFGSGLLSLYLGYDAWKHWGEAGSALIAFAALCYVVGTLAVTMVLNVPLNNALAAVQPGSTDGHQLWSVYLDRWTLWNHARGLAAFAASGLYVWALRLL